MSLVSIHPKDLAETFDNVVHVCTDKTATYNEVVKIEWGNKHLYVHGRGRYTASVERREVLIEPSGMGEAFYAHITELKEVASVLKKVEGAGRADTTVTIHLDAGRLVINSGTVAVAVLDDVDPERLTESTTDSIGQWEEVLDVMSREPLEGRPLAFTRDIIKRLDKVRVGKTNQPYDVFDFAWLGGNTVGVKFGKNMTVLLETVEREGYQEGGKYKDGTGEPGSLF